MKKQAMRQTGFANFIGLIRPIRLIGNRGMQAQARDHGRADAAA